MQHFLKNWKLLLVMIFSSVMIELLFDGFSPAITDIARAVAGCLLIYIVVGAVAQTQPKKELQPQKI
jgi:hypothetical protein